MRPTDSMIDTIMRKYIDDTADNVDLWDAVFDEILDKYRDDDLVKRFIYMLFRDGLGEPCILEELHIGRTTYYDYRIAVLTQAGIIAVQQGLIAS